MAGKNIDWSFGPGHGPVSGSLNAAGAAMGTTMVASLAHLSPGWAVGAGAVAAVGSAVSAATADAPFRAVCYRAACWLGAGLWSGGTLWLSNPWAVPSWASLVVGSLAAATLGAGLARAERKERKQQDESERGRLQDLLSTPTARRAMEWERRLARVCGIQDAKVVGIKEWETGTGYTVDVNLPRGGVTWKTVRNSQEGLASDARLPEGCGVEVGPGADRGSCLIKVDIINALAGDVDYPSDGYPHETINNPRNIGVFKDGQLTQVPLRQESVLVTGQTGSGKTTTSNVLIAEVLKCVDVIPLAIDFNGGSVALPWLLAWRQHQDQVPRPPFDWVATDPAEALLMTDWILKVAKDRKSAYAHVKAAANTTLLPISPQIPQLVLFVDESAEILGLSVRDSTTLKVQQNILEIIRIGRDSGARVVISALGATTEYIGSTQVKQHSRVSIAMRGYGPDALGHQFDVYNMSPEDAPYPGSGFIRIGTGNPVRPWKSRNIKPNQLAEVVIATSDRRPAPDDRALALGGDAWAKRWERAADLLAVLDQGAAAVEAILHGDRELVSVGQAPVNDTKRKGEMSNQDDVPELGQALADMEAARQRMLAEAAAAAQKSASDDLDRQFEEAIKGLDLPLANPVRPWDTPPGTPQPARPDWRTRVLELVRESGPAGIMVSALVPLMVAEGYETNRQTIVEHLRKELAKPDGLIRQACDRQPYVHRDHAG